ITDDGESRLNWSNKWPMFLQAAMLVRDSDAYTEEFDTAMRAMTVTGLNYSTAYKQTENRAMWGVVLNLASGAFLGDRAVFDKALFRWSDLMATCIAGNVPVSEIDRGSNSLYYCNFYLNAATQAAEIARFSGEWLYDWTGPDGSTFRETWQKVAYWTAHPEAFPYWQPTGTPRIQAHVDPLHALWPTDDSQLLIDTYTTTQDYFGFRQGILAYRGRPLFG
ncbi:alginate lyase family protein, partial [Microbacterium sp. KR10-403]|uniref:alginate lyase family protein n=1 Tax=Microbacterium sp. KR10-403 TaxID=3158581 RepID=UPI0032E378EC